MVPTPLVALARSPRPTDIRGVIERLHAIEDAFPARHGVATFNRLYRWTTENVERTVVAGRFEDPDAMVTLDVRFANLYFDAVDGWALSEHVPGAWAPLLGRGGDLDVAPLRFALAGMHAHINRDLAVAVAETEADTPTDDGARFRDYHLINAVLDETSDQVRHHLLPPLLAEADAALGDLDDKLIIGTIAVARRGAWEAAQLLWRLRHRPLAWRTALGSLDLAVGASARLILLHPELPRFVDYRDQLAALDTPDTEE